MNKLYLMDCMDGMKEFPDKFFHLAIVDVPYGIGEDGEGVQTCGRCEKDFNVEREITVSYSTWEIESL